MTLGTKWNPGERLISRKDSSVVREIVDVSSTGYGWKYPEFGETTPSGHENYFRSENSSDPMFELGWSALSHPSDISG